MKLSARKIATVMAVSFGLATAAPVRIRVTDPVGADGLARVLIIIQSLEGKGEVLRTLSDSTGSIGSKDLPAGVYRVIATYPYGYWFTQAQEFVVSELPVAIELRMDGAVVERMLAPEVKVQVTVVDREGKPVQNASVLGRDPDATVCHWDRTDARGQAAVTIGTNGADIVVIYKGQVITRPVNIEFSHALCSDDECQARRVRKLQEVPTSVTLHLK